jgi:predicted metallo-beta-lactamase superfamily hydrolase
MKTTYQRALPILLEHELHRSESWPDFLKWLKSNDRAAKDITKAIKDYDLGEQARAWIAKRNELYKDNPEKFQRDKKHHLFGVPKNFPL